MMFRRLALVLIALAGAATAGTTVNPGWDLFRSLPGTTFGGVPFTGVPLGTFDFGGSIGTQGVGPTDTIVQRLDPAAAPSTAISIEMVALQLVSSIPTDFGLGVGFYFVTLQSARGGPDSLGRMTINFGPEAPPGSPHGTFDSFFDVFFDIRLGSLAGPIAISDNLLLTQSGAPWNHFPPPLAIMIPGVNVLLNGQNEEADFWPIGTVIETHPTGAQHLVGIPQVPEPGTWSLLIGGAAILLGLTRRRGARVRSDRV